MAEIEYRAEKRFRHDADDGEWLAVQINHLAHNTPVRIEAPLPQRMTDHRHRMRIRSAIFFRRNDAPQHRFNAHHVEIIAADQFAPADLCAFAVAGMAALAGTDGCRYPHPCAEVRKALVLFA